VDRGGPELIQAKDAAGNDCLAEAPPNVKGISAAPAPAHSFFTHSARTRTHSERDHLV